MTTTRACISAYLSESIQRSSQHLGVVILEQQLHHITQIIQLRGVDRVNLP